MYLAEARARVQDVEAQLEEHPVTPGRVFVEPGLLIADGHQFQLVGKGLELLCRHVKAPPNYIETLPLSLQAELFRYHIDRGDLGKAGISIISRNSDVVGLGRA